MLSNSQDLCFYTNEAMVVPFDFYPEEGVDPADLPTLAGATYDFVIKSCDLATTHATLSSGGGSPRITVLGTPRTDNALGTALASIDVDLQLTETGGLPGVPDEFRYYVLVTFASGRQEVGVPPTPYRIKRI